MLPLHLDKVKCSEDKVTELLGFLLLDKVIVLEHYQLGREYPLDMVVGWNLHHQDIVLMVHLT